jgi:hypothetical protein
MCDAIFMHKLQSLRKKSGEVFSDKEGLEYLEKLTNTLNCFTKGIKDRRIKRTQEWHDKYSRIPVRVAVLKRRMQDVQERNTMVT